MPIDIKLYFKVMLLMRAISAEGKRLIHAGRSRNVSSCIYPNGGVKMNREELTKQTMQRLGVWQKDASAAFPEFQTVKNRFLYGEVWAG